MTSNRVDPQGSAIGAAVVLTQRTFKSRDFNNRDEIIKWLDSVCSSKWFRSRYHWIKAARCYDTDESLRAVDRKGEWDDVAHITLQDTGWTQMNMLYQLARCVSRGPHDRTFCYVYHQLVQKFVGRDEAAFLAKCFRLQKIRYCLPKRAMDPITGDWYIPFEPHGPFSLHPEN